LRNLTDQAGHPEGHSTISQSVSLVAWGNLRLPGQKRPNQLMDLYKSHCAANMMAILAAVYYSIFINFINSLI